jgi:hypothetical protein
MGKRRSTRSAGLGTPDSKRLYTLQVFLIDGPVGEEFAERELSRTIQIRGNQTLADLHRAIFDAFDREEEHMYEFQFGKGPHDPEGPRYTLRPGLEAGDARETFG